MAVTTKSNKNIEITKDIMVDNVQVEQVRATINTGNPENANLTHYISNQTIYKANRTEIRAAEAAAEDELYGSRMQSLRNWQEVTKIPA